MDDRFHTTRWSVIRSARTRDEPGSAEALARLCETYWYPLYAFVRRQGAAPEEAGDLTQGYFVQLLEKNFLESVRPEAGRFRSFLLVSLKHYLANQRRAGSALKRGGSTPCLSLDLEGAEVRYRREPHDDRTPDRAYERQWALSLIGQAHRRLSEEFEAAGKARQYHLLAGHLAGEGDERAYRALAAELDSTEAAIKMAVSRMRRRFGRILREVIAATVEDPREVDTEVRYLLSMLP
jgi:RNA polymerase sigma-70 factor (ECF subfamily)